MRDHVLCPACRLDDDTRSVVRLVESGSTDAPVDEFWDEEGDFHIHDLSLDCFLFACSRGHSWEETAPQLWCWCEDEGTPTWREREAMAYDAADRGA